MIRPDIDALVDKGESCWNWLGDFNQKYQKPVFILKKKKKLWIHRYFFEAFFGPIPRNGNIFRKCWNQRCCNPEHLLLIMPGETQPQRPGVQVGEFFQQKQHMQSIKAEQ